MNLLAGPEGGEGRRSQYVPLPGPTGWVWLQAGALRSLLQHGAGGLGDLCPSPPPAHVAAAHLKGGQRLHLAQG